MGADPRFFVFDRDTGREVRLLDEGATFEGRPLDPFKFIVHKPHLKSGLPIRSGLARIAAVSWMCKGLHPDRLDGLCRGVRHAAAHRPVRRGSHGQGHRHLRTAVANLGTDAAAVLPDSMRIGFPGGGQVAGGPDLSTSWPTTWTGSCPRASSARP